MGEFLRQVTFWSSKFITFSKGIVNSKRLVKTLNYSESYFQKDDSINPFSDIEKKASYLEVNQFFTIFNLTEFYSERLINVLIGIGWRYIWFHEIFLWNDKIFNYLYHHYTKIPHGNMVTSK